MRRPADSLEGLADRPESDGSAVAERLNRGCACVSVDRSSLQQALDEGEVGTQQGDWRAIRPHLFSDSMVFVSAVHLQHMAQTIAAIERVIALPAYREKVLAYAPQSARYVPAAAGVFLGYDFHLGPDGPQLIEINSNAGGALLNARLLGAQRACCTPVAQMMPDLRPVENDFLDMFRNEWRLARGDASDRPLECIAIVDEHPDEQYLAPEFELFRRLFEGDGIAAMIADPRELSFDGASLRCRGRTVDLVYNRLTDFALIEPQHADLLAAYQADAVVVTPHPHVHALFADKRNLAVLGDSAWLTAVAVAESDRRLLAVAIPRTEPVSAEHAERFWRSRREWFFKPVAGFGSKATYRGDKMTRRVFEEVVRGDYVAQAIVSPSERRLLVDGIAQDFKLDLRNYVYRGRVQLVSARLYRGQTTNFRTPGGGFASVFPVPSAGEAVVSG